MIKGPTDYVPCVESEVVTRRKAIPLDVNEGIYVRDIKSGKIRAVIGETYMLNQDDNDELRLADLLVLFQDNWEEAFALDGEGH